VLTKRAERLERLSRRIAWSDNVWLGVSAVASGVGIWATHFIAMLAYEFIRFAGRNRRNPVVKVLIIPFLLTQKLTTREPDDRQLEVALASFQAARQEEQEAAA
jgi:hypothetical protein